MIISDIRITGSVNIVQFGGLWKPPTNTLVNVYVDLVVFTRIAGTS